LSAHSSGVSQRLSLPGNFSARLCKPLHNAGGLSFKELLWTQENRAGLSQHRIMLSSSYYQGKKNHRSLLCDTDQAG
jgi:hypothetical protein